MSKAFLFVDEANLYIAARNKGWKIDWVRFLSHVNIQFDIAEAFLYEGEPTESSIRIGRPTATDIEIAGEKKRKTKYFEKLRNAGYTVRHKPVSTINGRNKCNFDVEIAVDSIDRLNDYDTCVLASGDGDFIRLVKYLRGKGKEIHIIGPKKSSKELKKEARGNFKSIRGMRSHIKKS